MQIIEGCPEDVSGEKIGDFEITTQVDRELLHGEKKGDLHSLIRKETLKKFAERAVDIGAAIFHVDGIEKGVRPTIRIHVTAKQLI